MQIAIEKETLTKFKKLNGYYDTSETAQHSKKWHTLWKIALVLEKVIF